MSGGIETESSCAAGTSGGDCPPRDNLVCMRINGRGRTGQCMHVQYAQPVVWGGACGVCQLHRMPALPVYFICRPGALEGSKHSLHTLYICYAMPNTCH